MNMREIIPEMSQDSRSGSPDPYAHGDDGPEACLQSILNELREFRRDSREQLSDIKHELKRANERLDEAEGRIDETENVLQAASTLINQLMQRQANLEAKLVDQEGRARRDNLRIYGIPEGNEGSDMIGFVDKLMKNALDLPADRDLGIDRAHRALSQRRNDPQAKPRSIIVKFGSYRTKEEILRSAWQKKQIFYNDIRFYVDHDFPIEVLKKRSEYTEAKKVLREKRIKFQTPYPARMRVFYEDGTRVFQDASEATRDMAERGLPVKVVKSSTAPDRETRLLSTWQVARRRLDGGADQVPGAAGGYAKSKKGPRSQYKEKLREFKRQSPRAED